RPPAPRLFPYTTLFRSVREDQPSANFGTATDVEVNPNAGHRKHALVGFDLSGAGISGSVTSATLRLRFRDGANLPRTDGVHRATDRKSTRLNSSHVAIS